MSKECAAINEAHLPFAGITLFRFNGCNLSLYATCGKAPRDNYLGFRPKCKLQNYDENLNFVVTFVLVCRYMQKTKYAKDNSMPDVYSNRP